MLVRLHMVRGFNRSFANTQTFKSYRDRQKYFANKLNLLTPPENNRIF